MMNEKDLLTALQNGEKPEDLANKFAEMLNAAIDAHSKAAQDAERLKAEKKADAQNMINAVMDFFQKHYPSVYSEDLRSPMLADLVIMAADEALAETQKKFGPLEALLESKPKVTVRKNGKVVEDSEDALMQFLRKEGLLNS